MVSNSSRFGVTKQGRNRSSPKRGIMAKATKASSVGSKTETKVTRKFVTKLNEFVETRSLSNLYKRLVDEGRAGIFAEIGEKPQDLLHNGVKVATISKISKPFVNVEKLKKVAPEAYEACLEYRDEFHIKTATPTK